MALPPAATVEVWLEALVAADGKPVVLAKRTIDVAGRQVPIPFALSYVSTRIGPGREYAIRATIRGPDGELLFATPEPLAVLPSSDGSAPVNVLVHRVVAGAALGGAWRLVAIERPGEDPADVPADPPYNLAFDATGRYFGQAHCNRYAGGGTLYFARVAAPGAGVASPAGDDAGVARQNPEIGFTRVFDCDPDTSFTVRMRARDARLWVSRPSGDPYAVLSLTPSGSGVRYQAGDTVVWIYKGDRARIELGGQVFKECLSNRSTLPRADATLGGIVFRAVGNQPGWYLEVGGKTLTMVTGYGGRQTELACRAPAVLGAQTKYRSADGALGAVVERVPCTDSMSGEQHDATVTVTLDGTVYRGCGRFHWRVVETRRERVVDVVEPHELQLVAHRQEHLAALQCERFVVREEGVHEIGVEVGPTGSLVEAERPACTTTRC